MYKKISYFPGLNALRFFAAFLVVIHHLETIRVKDKLYDTPHFSVFTNGGNGVYFFFVLSGFLITYLLLREYQKDHTVSVQKFYMRRVLRIWPLYFLLITIGVFIVPTFLQIIHFSYKMPYTASQALPWYLVFMPFMVNLIYGNNMLMPLWSIGVEELFYAIWAPLFKFLRKNIILIIAGIMVIKLSLHSYFYFTNPNGMAYKLLNLLAFECMSIGALGAIFVYNLKAKIESHFLFRIPMQIFLFAVLFGEVCAHAFLSNHFFVWHLLFNTPIVSGVIRAILFCWLIINISVNPGSLLKLENRILDYLGKVSYGIYMYQMCIIFGVELIFKKQHFGDDYLSLIIYNFTVMALLIGLAALSKHFFEDYFLRLKHKFEVGVKNNKKTV